MVWVATLLAVLAGIAYFFAPAGKSEAFMSFMTLAGGFIFGKFTNGYKRRDKDQDP